MISFLRKVWVWLTYIKVTCENCRGTGICASSWREAANENDS